MRVNVAIVGGGPGGATQAMFLAAHGIRTTVIEMDSFPRYQIGESMTGECGGILRTLGLEQYMLAAEWPRKEGVKVYGEGGHNAWFLPIMRRTDAGELQDQITWQVRRSDFDLKLLEEVEARGATVTVGRAHDVVLRDDGSIKAVRVTMADGGIQDIECDVLVDASGQKNFLAQQGVASAKTPGRYDRQIAIFSQFTDALRDSGPDRADCPDNTLIFYASSYHWAWFIPLDANTVSVGVVTPSAYFKEQGEGPRDFLLRELRQLHPELTRRLTSLEPVEEVRVRPNYSFEVSRYTGKNWLCLGDAHRFIDPIFSFGLYVTMKEAELATPHIVRYLNGATRHEMNPFAAHQEMCDLGLDRLQDLIDGFWGAPLAFAFLVNGARTREGMIDLMAGRVYADEPCVTLDELALLAEKARAANSPGKGGHVP